jgi:DNA-binding GntR family transcriptional regulator
MLDQSSPFLLARPPRAESKNAIGLKRLRHALVVCEIRPGCAFSESELETRYGLSRASIRVALTSLAAEGLVMSQPRKGWRAAPVTGASIGDLLNTRRRIEPHLVEGQLEEQVAGRLDMLAMVNAALLGRSDPQSLATARATDRQILDLLAESQGYFLRKWLSELWDHSARVVHFLEQPEACFASSDRRPLVSALRNKDRAVASAEISREVDRLQQFLWAALLRLDLPLSNDDGRHSANRTPRRVAAKKGEAAHRDLPARMQQTRENPT